MNMRAIRMLCLATAVAASVSASAQNDVDVLVPIQGFFQGIGARNAAQVREPFIPGTQLVFLREDGPAPSSIEQFADRLASSGKTKLDESIHDPVIRVKNDLAMVWAPAVFKIDGKVDHCAIDHFVLLKQKDTWRITAFFNTRTSCD